MTRFDAFGRIYEYFLGEFARTEGQKGGEFYTPAPIVRLMVEILEPFHGQAWRQRAVRHSTGTARRFLPWIELI